MPEISIHALLAESDRGPPGLLHSLGGFLSTLSLRRATYTDLNSAYGALISIHALLAESDNLRVVDGSKSSIISIHALLAESDTSSTVIVILRKNFYPRSPCGERHTS